MKDTRRKTVFWSIVAITVALVLGGSVIYSQGEDNSLFARVDVLERQIKKLENKVGFMKRMLVGPTFVLSHNALVCQQGLTEEVLEFLPKDIVDRVWQKALETKNEPHYSSLWVVWDVLAENENEGWATMTEIAIQDDVAGSNMIAVLFLVVDEARRFNGSLVWRVDDLTKRLETLER